MKKIVKGFRLLRITFIEFRLRMLQSRKYRICKKLGDVKISSDCPPDVSKFFTDLLALGSSLKSNSSEDNIDV